MPAGTNPMRLVRKLLPYTTAGLIVAVIYLVWVFASRWSENRRIAAEAEEQRAKFDRQITTMYGDGQLKILNFYATPSTLRRGEKGLVCYGVANAKAVRLDPPVERVWPSVGHCFEVAPRKDTHYTLTAEDAKGHTAEQSFVLPVK
jgi:hypothetical protein